MKSLLRLLSFALLPLAVTATANARSPEETLLAYVAAVQKDGIKAAVRFIHPEELASFRRELEPELAKFVKNKRTRPRFTSFADPYNQSQLRPFKDDADFTIAFINWMNLSGTAPVTTYDNTTVTPIGCVIEGEFRHVVARYTFKVQDQSADAVTVTSMRMNEGQPMLMLLPELRQVANMVRQQKV